MMYATRIKMKKDKNDSNDCLDIKEIYIEGCERPGFYTKEAVYNSINNGNKIYVNIKPFPELECATSKDGEKFVRSEKDLLKKDNLLELPRE